jgi:hypothetical protein
LRAWKRFGALVCVNVLEHLEDSDRERFFRLLPALLLPGSRLYIVNASLYHPLQLLSGLLKPGMLLTDPTHVHCWTQQGFRRMLEGHVRVEKELSGNILARLLPWSNRFDTARLYVCRPPATSPAR